MKKFQHTLIIIIFFSIALIVSASTAGKADAVTIIFPLDHEISKGAIPQGTAPWATATFIDVGSNNVQLTMSANNLTGTEFITQWYFNSSLTGLTFTPINISAISAPAINQSADTYKADGDGYFDIIFNFQTSAGPGRFQAGESVMYNIYAPSLSASSFNLISAPGGGTGQYNSVAKVQGISGNDSTSGWVANSTVVPEPISSILFIIGGILLGGRFHLRKKELI